MTEKKPKIPKITTDRKTFNKIVKIVQQNNLQEISFDFLIASLFPTVHDNIVEALRLQHAQGYAEGLIEGRKESQE